MTWWLMAIVVVLIGAAIAVQAYYVRGLRRAGIEVTTATKVVSGINITLLVLVGLGLLIFMALGKLTSVGM